MLGFTLFSLVALLQTTVVSSEKLPTFLSIIVPLNSVQSQSFVQIGVESRDGGVHQYIELNLTYPNSTTSHLASLYAPCGEKPIDNNTFGTSYISFDNSQAGNYTLTTIATYGIPEFNNCTGTFTNLTSTISNPFVVASSNANSGTNPKEEVTLTMAFPTQFSTSFYPYSTGVGKLNVNYSGGSSKVFESLRWRGIALCLLFAIVLNLV